MTTRVASLNANSPSTGSHSCRAGIVIGRSSAGAVFATDGSASGPFASSSAATRANAKVMRSPTARKVSSIVNAFLAVDAHGERRGADVGAPGDDDRSGVHAVAREGPGCGHRGKS